LDFGESDFGLKQARGFQAGDNPKLENRKIINPKSKIELTIQSLILDSLFAHQKFSESETPQ
jgi:hypothetical protein